MATQIIAIANNKGGTGKTATTINLGKGLAIKGKKVLLIDNDPQANLSSRLGIRIKADTSTVYDVYKENASLPIVKVEEFLHVTPSSRKLETIPGILAEVSRNNYRLADALELVSQAYDYILIDCPPATGLLTANALSVANLIIVPVTAGDRDAIKGMVNISGLIKKFLEEGINPDLQDLRILVNSYKKNHSVDQATEMTLQSHYQDNLLRSVIRENTQIKQSEWRNTTVFEHSPKSSAVKDYTKLTEEVLSLVS